MAKSLRGFLEKIENEYPAMFRREKELIDPKNHEVSGYIKVMEEKGLSPTVLFENVKNLKDEKSKFPLAYNVFATRSLCALALDGLPSDFQMELGFKFAEIEKKTGELETISKQDAPVMQNVLTGDKADVEILPAARYHEKDAGPYFVMAPIMKSYDGSFYDVTAAKDQIFGPHKLSISADPVHHHSQMLAEYEKRNEKAPVAIILGHHPAFYLGAVTLQPLGNNDYETIAAFLNEPMRLVPSATFGDDFLVPADAEIIIEGYIIPGVREKQNLFGEISGHYQEVKMFPTIEVTAICHRDNAIMQGVVPAHTEHIILGGLPKEGSIYNAIKKVCPPIKAVHLAHSGQGRFSAYVSLTKRTHRDVMLAGMIAFTEVHNLKLVVVVDPDVDVFDETEVMWAIVTQTRWDKDLAIIPRVQVQRGWLGDAVCIIDATRVEDPDFPERNKIPLEAIEKIKNICKF